MKMLFISMLTLLPPQLSFAQCSPSGLEECLSPRQKAARFMELALKFENQKSYGDAANYFLAAKMNYLKSAELSKDRFPADAAEDRRKAEEAAKKYSIVDELALREEQQEN